jgi:hypothetical protein
MTPWHTGGAQEECKPGSLDPAHLRISGNVKSTLYQATRGEGPSESRACCGPRAGTAILPLIPDPCFPSLGGSAAPGRRVYEPQRRSFVDRHMVRLVACNEVLRLGPRRVMHVALESNVRDHLLENYPANSPRFRVPFDVVAPLERFRQSSAPYLPEIYLGPSRSIDPCGVLAQTPQSIGAAYNA